MALPAALALLAAAAQVALTLWAIVRMGLVRMRAVRSGQVSVSDIMLDERVWPEAATAQAANLRNQFETPVILFAGIAIALAVGAANWGVALFAWGYVGARIVHRIVHVGSNRLGPRFRSYVAGLAMLAGLWASLVAGALLP